jgi:hypothetical protein
MTRWYNCIFLALITLTSCGRTHLLEDYRYLKNYPSASGIEYYNHQFYVIGDDATHLLILDSNPSPIDSIPLFAGTGKRLPKETKPDLESISMTGWREKQKLLMLGSGSLSPYRDYAWMIEPGNKNKDSVYLGDFFKRLRSQGIQEINLEGTCTIPGFVVLANRGHKGYPKNFLVFTGFHFWKDPGRADFNLIQVGAQQDSSLFNGVSGIGYAKKSDRLILTISTEDTRSVYEDGTIGKSYLWIIKNISSKRRWKSVNPDQVIDLEAIDNVFKGHKIESVCVVRETTHFLYLVLAADNDDGTSSLFRVMVEKN